MEVGNKSGLVSLVIAVSGHKDLYHEDSEDITERIKAVIEDLSMRYPQTPILILTGMADGADRLAVAAVERLRAGGNERISYLPVLPMPRDAFLEEIKSQDSRKDFDRQTSGRAIVQLPIHVGSSFDQICIEGSVERNQQYIDLAEFMVRTSQILIAVWNGHETGLRGGTSEVVQRKLGRFKAVDEPFQPNSQGDEQSEESYGLTPNAFGTGPVFHIMARRQSQPDCSPEVTEEIETPEGTCNGDFEEIYLLLNEYNRDVQGNRKRVSEAEERSRKLTENHSVTNSTPAMLWTSAVYGWADLLAERYQTINLLLWGFVFLFLALGGVMLHLLESIRRADIVSLSRMTAVYYFGVLAALGLWLYENGWVHYCKRTIVAWFAIAFKKARRDRLLPRRGLRFRRKHEDYRALAEALRVQYFWLGAGMDHMACEYYLDKHAGDMVWVRDATSESLLYRFETAPEPASLDQLSRSLGGIWIQGQLDYFGKRERREAARHKRIAIAGGVLATPTLIVPMIRLLLCQYGVLPKLNESIVELVPSLAMLFAVMGSNYAELRGFEQHAQQSGQMCLFYRRAHDRLRLMHEELAEIENGQLFNEAKLTAKKQEIRRFLLKVGRDALGENGDWLAMHRGRDLKLDRAAQ